MVTPPSRLLLDTNVLILGFLDLDGPEGRVLRALRDCSNVTLIFPNELIAQVQRVARRTKSKDWAGYLLDRIWRDYVVEYVIVTVEEKRELEALADIPREDVGVYLTARQHLFECLTPEEFLRKYFE